MKLTTLEMQSIINKIYELCISIVRLDNKEFNFDESIELAETIIEIIKKGEI